VTNLIKIVGGVGVFAAAFLVAQLFFRPPPSPKEVQAQVDEEVAKLKPTLPQKVHPMVTWFDVESGPRTIIYKYQIHAARTTVMSKREEMEAEMKKSPMIWAAKLMMPQGVSMRCELYDDNRDYMFAIDLD
jgi:hypothetical protein